MNLTTMEQLKILLDRKNIKYSDIARSLRKTPQSISKLFNADNISIEKLKEIAGAAGYDVVIEFKEKK